MKLYTFILFFFVSLYTYAQEPYYLDYTINDGLPTNTIYSVFQEDSGMLWFTTDVGIIKYNSKNLKLFSTNDGLADNEVFKIKKDSKNRYWFVTLNGAISYRFKGEIYNASNANVLSKIEGKSMVVDFFIDKKDTIYIARRNGDISIISPNNSVKNISINNAYVFGIWASKNKVFALTSKGIMDVLEDKIINTLNNKSPYRTYHIKQKTFFSKGNKLFKIIENRPKLLITLKENTDIINIYRESDSKLWVCTRNGVHLYKNSKLISLYFKNCVVSSILKDRENNYWISTLNKGVFFVPSFNVKQLKNSENKRLRINTIATKSDNEIWFGGYENDYYIKKGKQLKGFKIQPNWREDYIKHIRFFNDTTFVIGKTGTLKIDYKKHTFYKLSVNDIYLEKDTIYTATTHTSKTTMSNYNSIFFENMRSKVILNRRSNVLQFDDSKNLWIGTNLGLFKYNKTDSLKRFMNQNKAFETSVEDLYFDNENKMLLAATSSKGLLLLKNDSIKHVINDSKGLNNNTANSIEKLGANNYLIGTNKGLNLIKLKNNSFDVKNLNAALGFKNKKINAVNFTNDTLYVATNNELLFFDYDYLKNKSAKPVCIIDYLLVKNNKTDSSKQLNIPYSDNEISIRYTGLSYIDQGNVTFFYKLNTENNTWSNTRETQINYQALAAKTYTFSIYCVNGFGEKSETKTVTFTIQKPFWQQWYFYATIALLLLVLIFGILKFRERYLNKQFSKERKAMMLTNKNIALENQMLALEQKALRLQMNPHFIFNALNTIKGYYSEGHVREASDYISQFSKLLRLILENIEQYIPIALEIEMLTLYLDLTKVRYNNKFDYNIIVEDAISQHQINIPALLLQPLVENAIIHGIAPKKEKGNLLISFKRENEQLICAVTDNGIGRVASHKKKTIKHDSKAIGIIKERLAILETSENINCNIIFHDLVENSVPKGTKVEITLPIIKN